MRRLKYALEVIPRSLGNIRKKVAGISINRKITFLALFFLMLLYIWTNPPSSNLGTIKIYDRNGILLYEQAGSTGRRQPVDFEIFPEVVIKAVLATEDEAYFSHPGVDLKAILRSALINIQSREVKSGASTIPQQVARLNTGERTSNLVLRIFQKIRETIIALRLSVTHSKTDILSMYLNNVYLGNHTYGFQAAAQYYFKKNVDKLSLNEVAYLTGMIASPAGFDPFSNYGEGEKRKNYVLSRMAANGYITKEELDEASVQSVEFPDPTASFLAPHFVDYILALLPALHISQSDISIYSTLDLPAYRLSTRIASLWVEKLRDIHNVHNAAMIVIENKSGAILSMLGGINYFDEINDGQVNVVTSPRQPGSAIKPITYASAFQNGITPATLIYDVKQPYITSSGEGFIPNNFGDTYHGLVLVREALASSYNLPAVEILDRIGLPAFLDTARSLGITAFPESRQYDYAITLGANEVSLLELSNAYATFARRGNFLPAYAIEEIRDSNGKVMYKNPARIPEPRLGEKGVQVAFLVTDILADPHARMPGFGEKNYLTLSRPAAVKTGTTTDWHDILAIGYTPSYTVGVWMGNNNNDQMRSISSATGAAPVWNQFLEEFLKDKPYEEFIKPEGITEKEVCILSGELYDGICPEKKIEYFIDGTEPDKISTIHKRIAVDTRNNLLADKSCPPAVVAWQLFVDYPPEVYRWAVENHKPVIPREFSPYCNGNPELTDKELMFISITNPKNKSVYQNAPELIRNQGIVLEVSTSQNIREVSWFVDNTQYAVSKTPPFTVTLPLQTGNHMVYARGRSTTQSIDSETVVFTVTDL